MNFFLQFLGFFFLRRAIRLIWFKARFRIRVLSPIFVTFSLGELYMVKEVRSYIDLSGIRNPNPDQMFFGTVYST